MLAVVSPTVYHLDNHAPEPEPAPIVEKVADEVLCARCGYDLRGLTVDQRCPECAAPVRNSMRAKKLEYAAPEFLNALIRGALLAMLSAIVALSTVALTALLILTAISFAAAGTTPGGVMIVLTGLWVIGPLACGSLATIGWWKLTTRDPGAGGTRRDSRVRKVLRICTAITGACWLISCVPMVAKQFMTLPPSVYIPLTATVGVVLAISVVVTLFASGPFMDELASRLDDERIGPMTTRQSVLGVVVILGALVFAAAIWLQIGGLVMLGFLGFGVGMLVLFGMHARILGTLRQSLMCARDGVPIPGQRKFRRTADIDIRDLR